MLRRVAWALASISLVAVVLDTVFTASAEPLLAYVVWAHHGWPLIPLATVGCTAMGLLIVLRHPRHRIGWLLLVAGTSAVSLACESYSWWVVQADGPGSELAGHVSAWASLLFSAPVPITAVVLVYLLAPTGHLPSPRWRGVARGAVCGLVLYLVGVALIPPTTYSIGDEDVSTATGVLNSLGITLLGLMLVASAVGLLVRLRRAAGEVRRQLLWIATSACMLASALVFLLVVSAFNGGEQTLVTATPLFLSYALTPVCIAIAVLRHRLVDIDLIVNRALLVVLATGAVAAAYVLAVVTLRPWVSGREGWPALLTTALVALAFQPLRRSVVRLADRLAYGAAAAPYDALADFSRRLADSPDPSQLLPAVADAAASAVGAAGARAVLHVPGGTDLVAGTGVADERPGVTALELPVSDGDDVLGLLGVTMPAGRGLRERDVALLRDLADQTVVPFRNARLAAELSSELAQLAARTDRLAESRRRLIGAGDAERDRLERAIVRDVVPHLRSLPDRLEGIAARGAQELDATALQPLLADTVAALEALREITRGVYPAQLVRSGLESALRSLLSRTGTATLTVDALPPRERTGPQVESAAYFCVAEAARDLASVVCVTVTVDGERLVVRVTGRGRLDGVSLANVRDRTEAVGGELHELLEGGDVVLEARLPLGPGGRPAAQPVAAAQAAVSRSGSSSALVT